VLPRLIADLIWPALFLEQRLFSFWPIVLGLVVEFFFVRHLTNLSLWRCLLADVTMNAVSALLGAVFIPLAGIAWEIFPGLILSQVFHLGTFNPGTWAATFLFSVLVSAVLESLVLYYGFKQQPFRRIFWWMCAANSCSVGLAFVSLFAYPSQH